MIVERYKKDEEQLTHLLFKGFYCQPSMDENGIMFEGCMKECASDEVLIVDPRPE